jgi:hypothetical protein
MEIAMQKDRRRKLQNEERVVRINRKIFWY